MNDELNEPQGKYAIQNQKDISNPDTLGTEGEQIAKRVSLEEYLDMIADGERRLEFHDGKVVDIQSATEQHGRICMNLSRLVDTCLLEKNCDAYAGDRELWVEACRKMFYPDLMVVCDKHDMKQMSENVKATINPSIIIEVLSDSTEKFDLSTKMRCYKTLKSLKQIIFVAQTEKYVLCLDRDEENDRLWLDIEYFEDDENIPIGDCNILLKDIYRRVEFENQAERATEA